MRGLLQTLSDHCDLMADACDSASWSAEANKATSDWGALSIALERAAKGEAAESARAEAREETRGMVELNSVLPLDGAEPGETTPEHATRVIHSLRARMGELEEDLSVARQSLYKVAQQRNEALSELDSQPEPHGDTAQWFHEKFGGEKSPEPNQPGEAEGGGEYICGDCAHTDCQNRDDPPPDPFEAECHPDGVHWVCYIKPPQPAEGDAMNLGRYVLRDGEIGLEPAQPAEGDALERAREAYRQTVNDLPWKHAPKSAEMWDTLFDYLESERARVDGLVEKVDCFDLMVKAYNEAIDFIRQLDGALTKRANRIRDLEERLTAAAGDIHDITQRLQVVEGLPLCDPDRVTDLEERLAAAEGQIKRSPIRTIELLTKGLEDMRDE